MINKINKEKDISTAIADLEMDKIFQQEQLSDSFQQKVQSLTPANLIKSSAGSMLANPSLKKGLLVTVAGIGAILILKKLSRKKSGGKGLLFMAASGIGSMLIKRMLASGLQRVVSGTRPR